MREYRSFRIFQWVIIVVLGVFALLPVYVMFTSSVKSLRDIQGAFQWWPSDLDFSAFTDMWRTVPLARYFGNSLIDSGSSTIFAVIVAVLAGYGISRFRFYGRNTLLGTVLATQMFPGVLFLLPLFLIFVNIDNALGFSFFYQTRLGLIITFLTFNLPFAIWMLTSYFDGIPKELDEAARIDGTTSLGALIRVVIPVARPGIVAVAVYCFMTSWGEILFASVMTDQNTATLAIGLQSYSTQSNVFWNQIMAATLVVSLPVVVGFLLVQRNLVSGLAAGGVKG